MSASTEHRAPRVHSARAGTTAVVVVLATALAGCGGGGADAESGVEAAQARVSAAKDDLKKAEAQREDQVAAACGASESYILALDRYGDVLAQTAVTVGDVTDAGDDLEQPRKEVTAEAEKAVEAQQAVVDAEQELADAQAELSAAKSPGATPDSRPPVASPEPLVPAATLNRVEMAEAELRAAQEGISDQTPLSQASEQFNAAVLALEMAWLRLLSDAGCLTDEQQAQAEVTVRDYTTALQTQLRDAGYYEGEVDGIYGPQTVDAVEALQEAHGLPVSGTVDKATAAALQDDLAAESGASAQQDVATTAAVQQTLALLGLWDGPVDGTWTPALTEAIKELQTTLGVRASGTVDAATLTALEKAVAELGVDPSPSETSEPSASPSSSESSEPSSPSSSEPSE